MFAPITTGPRGRETRIATAFAVAIALLGGFKRGENAIQALGFRPAA